jgi:type IV pilus assembly protein PilY1
MNIKRLFATLLAAAASIPALAEDIDLFIGLGNLLPNDRPNLLIVLDNAANFSASAANCKYSDGTSPSLNGTAGGWEQCAFVNVLTALKTNADGTGKVNIGMMGYNANKIRDINGANCGGANGGCLMVPLMEMNTDKKAEMIKWVKSWRTAGGAGSDYVKADGEQTGAAMQEAWAYYTGRTGLSGRNYAGVKPALGCSNNYVLFIGNAFNVSGTPADSGNASPKTALENAPGITSGLKSLITGTYSNTCGSVTIGTTNHENRGYYADEWARYMKSVDIENPTADPPIDPPIKFITTYSIGVLGSSCKPEYPALLNNMANNGGGRYFETDSVEELADAFEAVLSQIQSTNSVFASVSLPVSVNTQGTYLNQVFIGQFRPDANALPRWNGNLKQYKLGLANASDPTSIRLEDADSIAALDSKSGFIGACARSFWTPATTSNDNYWSFRPQGTCSIGGESKADDNSPDGNIVEKGGQAYLLRGAADSAYDFRSRKLYTCAAAIDSCTAMLDFNTTTATGLGVPAGQEIAYVNWAIGRDNLDENSDGNGTPGSSGNAYEVRPSVHGDVVHSRPVAMNFGSDSSPKVVVFYGANDGILRAINGNRSLSFEGYAPGQEIWSFMAPEFFGSIERNRTNKVAINYFGSTDTEAKPKPYGFDGTIASYTVIDDKGTPTNFGDDELKTAWIFPTMRRGGRAVYAFDVSKPTAPTLMWKKGCTTLADNTGCDVSGDFKALGQTWSAPKAFKVDGLSKPLLIMGGGHDNCEDYDDGTLNNKCGSTTPNGTHLYVLEAESGKLLNDLTKFKTDRSVVADVFVLNDKSGNISWAYAVDMGGNIYRVSGEGANKPIGTSTPDLWTMTKIASLGCDTANTACNANRKFLLTVDVVKDKDSTDDEPSYVILVGSGDREKPLDGYKAAYGVKNYFFMVRDHPSNAGWLVNPGCGGLDIICMDTLTTIAYNGADPSSVGNWGWKLSLRDGEQVVTSAITLFGVVNFGTQKPTSPDVLACKTGLGDARGYSIAYSNAKATNPNGDRSVDVPGGGLPPSPVAGVVTLDSGQTVPFLITPGSEGGFSAKPGTTPPVAKRPKSRTYWYIQK